MNNTQIDIYADNPTITNQYILAVVSARIECKEMQWRYNLNKWPNVTDNAWKSFTTSAPPGSRPLWNWQDYDYRVSPNSRPKKTVPMERDDYPPFFWVRYKDPRYVNRTALGERFETDPISGISSLLWAGAYIPLFRMPDSCEYSTDRKTWLPCTKEVAG